MSLCFSVIKFIKLGNISSVLKERSLGSILDMLRSEQWPLNGSQLSNLVVGSTLQRRGTFVLSRPRGSLGLEASNTNFL